MNELLLRAILEDFGVKTRLILTDFLFVANFYERFEVGGRWELYVPPPLFVKSV